MDKRINLAFGGVVWVAPMPGNGEVVLVTTTARSVTLTRKERIELAEALLPEGESLPQ